MKSLIKAKDKSPIVDSLKSQIEELSHQVKLQTDKATQIEELNVQQKQRIVKLEADLNSQQLKVYELRKDSISHLNQLDNYINANAELQQREKMLQY